MELTLRRIEQIKAQFEPEVSENTSENFDSKLLEALNEQENVDKSSYILSPHTKSFKYTTIQKDIESLITRHAQKNNLDPALVKAVVQAESNFNPNAISQAGAQGLMQLMPSTARSLGVNNTFDPEQNIAGGTAYLKKMIDKFGSVQLGLAAYNAGPGAVEKFGGVPPYSETKNYVNKIMTNRNNFKTMSQTMGLQRYKQVALPDPPPINLTENMSGKDLLGLQMAPPVESKEIL